MRTYQSCPDVVYGVRKATWTEAIRNKSTWNQIRMWSDETGLNSIGTALNGLRLIKIRHNQFETINDSFKKKPNLFRAIKCSSTNDQISLGSAEAYLVKEEISNKN